MADDRREKRWLVVAEDGRHVTLGRHSDPTDQELADAAKSLDEQNIAAWLVVSEGGYYTRGPVTLLMVRRMTARDGSWERAAACWQDRRTAMLAAYPE